MYTAPPARICLMAWVRVDGASLYREVVDADIADRRIWVSNPAGGTLAIPFAHVESVALVDGLSTLQAFGRPYQAVPAWVEYAEVSA